ncbi:MAG: DEAD/DEAH box helicase [Firmicutes bacterium]|nr:DEAD/DEAH box helicase [Bacillota bacterium]
MKKVRQQFAPGMRIIVRGEEWAIKKVETNSFGNQTIHAVGLSTLVKDQDARFLVDLENKIEIVNPKQTRLVIDESSFFQRSRLFIESQWRQKVPTHSNLHIGHEAAMNPVPFQLEPAQLALRQPRQRILIADAVGLGKTLEAGVLMSELIARGKGKRILVVTVKSMMTQFQKEMWNRFTIPLVRLDSKRIQRVRSQIPANHNPFYFYDRTIISMDTLKRDVEYRTHLEKAWWDIIVIDEAHNVATRGAQQAQRARLAQLLSERSDTLIMLSATPHDGRAESFASLMNMLDPTAIADPRNYTQEDIKGLFIRRFKKDVQDQVHGTFQERRISIERCQASSLEEEAFRVFSEMELEMDARGRGASQLFKTTLEKSMFSSPAACIKSIDERIRRIDRGIGDGSSTDIRILTEFRTALEQIPAEGFSRFIKLLELLNCPNYNWDPTDTHDRIVIFTERIETMRFLAEQLKAQFDLPENAIQTLYGGMSDIDQQRVVEDFGRTDSPMRILVASDVASEGINLHYLCYRLIHFDIPWSLMVFQQRNGRIDRYGQTKNPDIRYLVTESINEKVKGDLRILEILIEKEDQARQNIGDPALLMGVFEEGKEELITARALESGITPEEFEQQLTVEDDDFDPLELLLQGATSVENPVQLQPRQTMFSDLDYLRAALDLFRQRDSYRVEEMRTVQGLEIELNPELRQKLSALLPEEAFPDDNILRLSPNKDFYMEEMKRSLQFDVIEDSWPKTQYLWSLHPIFEWVNDRAGVLYGRQEAPLLGMPSIDEDEFVFIMAGTTPNRKSTPVVDEWFALHYRNCEFVQELSMDELMKRTRLQEGRTPNLNDIQEGQLTKAQKLLPDVVKQAQRLMDQRHQDYRRRVDPQIDNELDKLATLHERHYHYIQETLFQQHKRREQELRKVDDVFERFVAWVRETLEIEDSSFVRVIGVITGVSK